MIKKFVIIPSGVSAFFERNMVILLYRIYYG